MIYITVWLLSLVYIHSQELSQSRNSGGHKLKRHFRRSRRGKSNSIHGSRSLSKLSSSEQNLARSSNNLRYRGRSHSNISLGHAPSMTSVAEEPRKSTSTTSELHGMLVLSHSLVPGHFNYVNYTMVSLSLSLSYSQMSQNMNMTHWLMPPTSGQTSLISLATPKNSQSNLATYSTSMTKHLPAGSDRHSGSLG